VFTKARRQLVGLVVCSQPVELIAVCTFHLNEIAVTICYIYLQLHCVEDLGMVIISVAVLDVKQSRYRPGVAQRVPGS
jgi:hypothetical protein